MTRRAFFSFDYDDAWCAAQVRSIGAIDGNRLVGDNGWEEVKKKDDASIKEWIAAEMRDKSVVIVLIGENTSESRWVKYEIQEAWNERKGLLGIRIHGLKNRDGQTSAEGKNPFADIYVLSRKKSPEYSGKSAFGDVWLGSGNTSRDKPDNLPSAFAALVGKPIPSYLRDQTPDTDIDKPSAFAGIFAAKMMPPDDNVFAGEMKPPPLFPRLCLGTVVPVHNPSPYADSNSVYNAIKENLEEWIEGAIKKRNEYD